MGCWGRQSFEHDDVAEALDLAYELIHGQVYDDLMDDGNPLSFDEVQKKLASPETLAEALNVLNEWFGDSFDAWDEVQRLTYVGVVVRHASFRIPIPEATRARAIDWLQKEDIDWDDAEDRDRIRQKELALLQKAF